ncbi:ROK family transcriptional regulator [Paenibacillus doosanensis]|uniref:ROK family transcriptional regulator n=1 Tax=Paenibacillus doosanensis TaxID=1229154 RepID=UPI0021807834|nr:ROK family transcriptional regulator [Paenibacillus doosanensis]MCS7462401.1 ROK family transcriptional regulator [Paenibacillus doosanensis]
MLQEFVGLMSPKMKSLKHLYYLINKLGPVRINTLVEQTGYKHSTCSRLVEELVQAGLIYDSGLGESKGGRKPALYVIKPDSFYLIGAEISSLFTTVLLLDLQLNIIAEHKLKMNETSTPEYTLNFISERIDRMLAEHSVPRERLLGIGVGAIGPIDRNAGTLLSHEHMLAGWERVHIVDFLQRRFQTTVLLDNGINLAALGEYRSKYWKQADSLVYTSSGVAIRCGIILQGQVLGSKLDMDDSLGHITVDVHGRRCSCGAYGCLEAYSSFPSVREEIVRRIKRGKASVLQQMVGQADEVQFHHILDALEQNDPLCYDVVRDAAYYYGIGLSNLIHLLRPEMVIVGGGLGANLTFYEITAETVRSRLQHYRSSEVQIVRASTGYNVVAVGAGCMVLDYFIEEKQTA